MHIQFQTLTYKNILSVGNNPVSVSLDSHAITLFYGANGEGKSTNIEALNYVLYGKPFRKVNVGDLVNNVNKKGLLVTLDFVIGKKNFRIERGIKPKVFNIYENGEPLDKEASNLDFQKELEYTILKMSPETFRQIVVLGSSSYVPYMRLPKGKRDAIIEDLLDIEVFSTMQKVIGDKNKDAKRSLIEIGHSIELINNTIQTTNEHIAQLQANNNRVTTTNSEQVTKLKSELEDLQAKRQKIIEELSEIDFDHANLQDKRKKRDELLSVKNKIKFKQDDVHKELGFFSDNLECPTCKQEITEQFRTDKVDNLTTKNAEFDDKGNKISQLLQQADESISKYSKKQAALQELTLSEKNMIQRTNSILVDIERLENAEVIDVAPSLDKVAKLNEDVAKLNTEYNSVTGTIEEYSFIQEILNTNGIKSSIVKTYLPVINGIIAKYLDILEFDANFVFDETFTETIKSQGRDPITYNGLSDGQKMRVDLCLLFAFRDVSKLKNSTSTNLLVFDEIGDNSLDRTGLDALMTIMVEESLRGSNIQVISHNPNMRSDERVSRAIRVHKVAGFTEHEQH